MVLPSKAISNGSTSLHTLRTARDLLHRLPVIKLLGCGVEKRADHSLRVYCRILCRLFQPHICIWRQNCSGLEWDIWYLPGYVSLRDYFWFVLPCSLILLIEGTPPVLRRLVGVKLDDDSSFDPWFPHIFSVRRLVVDPSGSIRSSCLVYPRLICYSI